MSEEELDKSVEDQKSINTSRSTQFALRTWQTWFEQSDFTRFFPSKMGNLWDIPELVMKVSNWENHR